MDETILGLQQRMVKLISEASAVASHACSVDSTVDDDAVVQRLSGAMASVEWILHCGSLASLRQEIGNEIEQCWLGEEFTIIASPRQSDGEDKFLDVWSSCIASVERFLEAACHTVRR